MKGFGECPFCGSTKTRTVRSENGWHVYCESCHAVGPSHKESSGARKAWSVDITQIGPDTDYRDRVDRMAAAIIVCEIPKGGYGPNLIARQAIEYVDAIDAVLKEREASDVQP